MYHYSSHIAEAMKAIWYDRFGAKPIVKQVAVPELHDDAALIAVKATGICRSDWHGWMGHDASISLPHVPGHEFAGEVIAIGTAVLEWEVGARVTTPFVQACGSCFYCHSQHHQVCPNQHQAGFTDWGSFAEFVEVRYADVNLVVLPKTMSYTEAAILGCRFGTAYHALLYQADLLAGQWLAVFGCGGLGLAIIMISKAIGAHVVAIDPDAKARKLAQSIGADEVYRDLNDEAVADILQRSGYGVHIGIDAYGSSQILASSLPIIRRKGKYLQVGLMREGERCDLSLHRVIAHELEIIGSHGIQAFRYGEMLDFIESHDLSLSTLLGTKMSLEEGANDMIKNAHTEPGIAVIIP